MASIANAMPRCRQGFHCTLDCKYTDSIETPSNCWTSKLGIAAKYQDTFIDIQLVQDEIGNDRWAFVLKEFGTYTFEFKTVNVGFWWEVEPLYGLPSNAITIELENADDPFNHRLLDPGNAFEYILNPSNGITKLPLTFKSSTTPALHDHGYAVIHFQRMALSNWVQTYWEDSGSSCARRLVAKRQEGAPPLTDEYEDDQDVDIEDYEDVDIEEGCR